MSATVILNRDSGIPGFQLPRLLVSALGFLAFRIDISVPWCHDRSLITAVLGLHEEKPIASSRDPVIWRKRAGVDRGLTSTGMSVGGPSETM